MPDRRGASAPAAAHVVADRSGADQRRETGEPGGTDSRDDSASPPGSAERGRLNAAVNVAGRWLSSRPVRWGFVVAAAGLGCYAVVSDWSSVRSSLADLGFATVIGALASAVCALVATMQIWRVLLAGLGSPLPVRPAARVLFVGQLGKYLPGSVWPVLAQMELGAAHKVPRHRSASASVLTMLLSLLTGLLAALATLPFVARSTQYRWVFLAVPVLLICLHPRVLNPMLSRLLRLARRPPLEQPLTGRVLAAALAWALLSWVLFGLQIWLLATRLGAPYGKTALLAVGGFAFAWCVGFVIVFLSAGIGVREVLLIAALGPVLGTGAATAVALVSRAVMTVGDLVTAAVAVAGTRRPGAPAASRPPP